MGCNGWVGCDGWGAVVGLRCSAMVGDEGQVVQDLLLSAKGCGKEALSRPWILGLGLPGTRSFCVSFLASL